VTIDKRFISIALASAFVVGACTGGGGTPVPSQPPASPPATSDEPSMGAEPSGAESMEPDPSAGGDISGEIVISGSSTVEPISTRVKELFNEQNPNVAISVDGTGTGDGFALFCAGETDISDASRAIKEEEAQACADAGVEYVELKVAIDGLSVITSAANEAIECVTFADIYALVGPESTGFDNWSDAQAIATELGSTTTLPDAPLTITAPGEESGTYDSFVEIVIEEFNEERGQEAETRPDYQASPNDNVIIDGVAGTADNNTTFGWVGFAFVEENLDRIKPLQVDGGEGCVEPTSETIANGEYPIARDLYIYVNKARAEENESLTAFVDYYVADGTIDQVLETVSYIALDETAFGETQAAWEGR
jgi:phosphate transport system substrate-binding protein